MSAKARNSCPEFVPRGPVFLADSIPARSGSAGIRKRQAVPARGTAAAAALLACLALACGSQYPESEYPSAPPAGVDVSVEDLTPAPPGSLWRRDVDAALEAGLGRFLQHVELQAFVDQGTFVGFRIVELKPPSWWQGVELAPGDIVTRVNGMPIEQPAEAHAAFESLRKTDKLKVSYLRSGVARELDYTILDKPLPGPHPS